MTAMRLSRTDAADQAQTGISDEMLARMLADGDASAGEGLVARHHEMLVRYLARVAGGVQAGEELAQQTWLSVLEHIGQFKPRDASVGFKSWLYRIATNKAHDRWRAAGRDRKAGEQLRLVRETTVPSADASLEVSEQHQRLRKAIEELPEPQKQVVMLKYYADMKFTEIAQVLGCPLNTALGRMHKATQKLKRAMEN